MRLLFIPVQVLLEKECEKNALLEMLLQTRGEVTEVCQQLKQLRREVAEQREHGQVRSGCGKRAEKTKSADNRKLFNIAHLSTDSGEKIEKFGKQKH